MAKQKSQPGDDLWTGYKAEEILERLQANGQLEHLHQEALRRVKDDPEFNQRVQRLVADSKAIRRDYQGAQRQAKLKDELEDLVSKEAVEKLWEVISSRDTGMAVKIENSVKEALAQAIMEEAQRNNNDQYKPPHVLPPIQ